MTIKYKRQAIARRTETYNCVQGNGSTRHEVIEVDESRRYKETFTATSEVDLATAATPDAQGQALTRTAVLENMIAEASDSKEQSARQFTLGILTQFSVLRRKLQQENWNPLLEKSKSKFAVNAGVKMMEMKQYQDFNDVGHVPGVLVGDWYSYTYELLLIGLHRHLRGNICHISSYSEVAKTKYNNQSVACSILIAENDKLNDDKLLFIGQGGKLRQSKAEAGNLALMNSCNMGLPVRVIRREKDTGSDTGQRFTYFGLYKVDKFFMDTGAHGHSVYKFLLVREGNQPGLETILPELAAKPDLAASPGALLTNDISQGVEHTPVRVVNAVDVNCPDTFHYTTTVIYPKSGERLPVQRQACECLYTCEGGVCSCIRRNSGGVSAYNDDGHLIRVRNIVYECGPLCNCSITACRNRVSQKGLRWRLEVFRTKSKGWGVRTLEFIPSGSFLCELTGELLTATVAAERDNDEYLFNLDFHSNARSKPGKGKEPVSACLEPVVHYVIDCRLSGNVARFINHCCEPNLFVQGVLHDHGDLNRGHIMLFAGEDIAAHTELSYDYGYELDSVRDIHGNVLSKQCHCGARFCRGRMY